MCQWPSSAPAPLSSLLAPVWVGLCAAAHKSAALRECEDTVLVRLARPLTSVVLCLVVLLVVFHCQVRLPTQGTRQRQEAGAAAQGRDSRRLQS